jgi:hypothetical protein
MPRRAIAARTTACPARAFSSAIQRPWTSSLLWSSTMREEPGPAAAADLGIGDEGAHQDVGDAALVGS